MSTDRRTGTAGRVAAHGRTLVAAGCLLVAAGSCAVVVTRPHWSASGTVLVVPNPVYAAASAQAVGPRALTADRTLTVPQGVAVAVEPAPGGLLRITVTAPDAVTARAVANRVLDDGLPAALRAQVAEGLRLRRVATAATSKVTAADVDAALQAYALRIVTVTRASGTTPSGADAVQAVAVAQVGGLPATSPDPQVATRLVAAALDPAAVDGLVNGRRAAAELTTPGGPALGVLARSGEEALARQVAEDVLVAARTPLTRLLRSSGLPAETLVLQPYVAPVAAPVRVLPPWWLTSLLGLAVAALAAAVALDRRDRRAAPLAVRRSPRPQAAGQGRPEPLRPAAARPAAPVRAPSVPLAPPGVAATLLAPPAARPLQQPVEQPVQQPVQQPAARPAAEPAVAAEGVPDRPWDWSPVRLAEYGGMPTPAAGPVHERGGPLAMPPADAPAHAAPQEVPADEAVADEDAAAVAPVSVVDLRTRIFGDGPDDGDGGVPAEPLGPEPDAGAGRVAPDPRPRLADLLSSGGTSRGPADGPADGGPAPDRSGAPGARHGVAPRHGHDGAAPAGVPAPPVMTTGHTGNLPPVMPPAMPGAPRATGDPTSFAPPMRSVVVEPSLPSVVRRQDPAIAGPVAPQPFPPVGSQAAQPAVPTPSMPGTSMPDPSVPSPSVPVDPRRPFGAQSHPVPQQPTAERPGPTLPGQTLPGGRQPRSVTPFVPPTVHSTAHPSAHPSVHLASHAQAAPPDAGHATLGWRPPVVDPSTLATPPAPSARPFPAGPVPVPLPVPLPVLPPEALNESAADPAAADHAAAPVGAVEDAADEPGDQAWSDILGSGGAPRRQSRPPKFPRGRR